MCEVSGISLISTFPARTKKHAKKPKSQKPPTQPTPNRQLCCFLSNRHAEEYITVHSSYLQFRFIFIWVLLVFKHFSLKYHQRIWRFVKCCCRYRGYPICAYNSFLKHALLKEIRNKIKFSHKQVKITLLKLHTQSVHSLKKNIKNWS